METNKLGLEMKKLLVVAITMFCALSRAQMNAKNLETLFGLLQDQEGITVQVFSGGCTGKDNFQVSSAQVAGVIQISITRTTMDYCRAYFQYGTNLFFSYEELGVQRGQKFEVQNLIRPSRRANF